MAAAARCREHLTLADLEHFLPSDKAATALKVLDADADGQISLHDMRDSVLQIYKARPQHGLFWIIKD